MKLKHSQRQQTTNQKKSIFKLFEIKLNDFFFVLCLLIHKKKNKQVKVM